VRPLPLPAALLLFTAAALAFAPGAALAHGGGAAMPTEVPASPPGDGATAQGILHELDARAEKDAETARVVAEPVKSAKRALERARGARTSGDELHARMLDGLALEWAESARDLDRAATAERASVTTSKQANEVETRAKQARALLEETQARRGRTAAELERVEADAREARQRAADVEAQRLEAAKRGGGGKGKAPPPPASKGGK
jgi:hypothetical protein